ncbi:MAG: glycoside hydrolase, partial [Lachnospiraceae bacterium]|nr:glycoside hydrolase [Lachnospiraceae bacterium]
HVDLTGLKDGDCCGLAAIQGRFGLVGIRADEDERYVVMCVNDGSGGEMELLKDPYAGSDIYLKISFDFTDNIEIAEFFYSADGKTWEKAGTLQLKYTLDHFMGCRMGLYSYATLKTGGFADFEYFRFRQ